MQYQYTSFNHLDTDFLHKTTEQQTETAYLGCIDGVDVESKVD